jgi:putative transposase
MIEAFFRSLKHSWLYFHTLDSLTALERLVAFYVSAHNEVMPHSAFEGQTPDEIYFGSGDAVPAELASARMAAREERLKANRAASCAYVL